MPASRSALHGASAPGVVGHGLRTLISFALIGFANAILPFLVFSASYLIIPFSRPVVLLIEILPALAVKFVLPHLFYDVPYWARPVVFGAVWAILAFIASVTAPNVETPIRIISCALAAATAAATEVSFLGLLRYYGKAGLVGWGFGTGLGALVCAIMPFVLTIWMDMFLRDAVICIYYLAALVVLVYFVVLPGKPIGRPATSNALDKSRMDAQIEEADEASTSLLVQHPQTPPSRSTSNFTRRVGQNLKLANALIPPYMLPLFLAFVAQAIVLPGISRAMGTSASFGGYSSYAAVYGLVFQLGNLVGRSSILFMRFQTARPLLIRLGVLTGILVVNALFIIISTPLVVFPLAFTVGLVGGAVYINTFSAAMEDQALKLGSEREFSLGVIGSGEAAGMLIGSLFGALFESSMCGMELGSGHRWCHVVR